MMYGYDGMTIMNFGAHQWLILVVTVGLILYPIGRILGRIGLSPYWSVLALFPVINLIGLWILAFATWSARQADR